GDVAAGSARAGKTDDRNSARRSEAARHDPQVPQRSSAPARSNERAQGGAEGRIRLIVIRRRIGRTSVVEASVDPSCLGVIPMALPRFLPAALGVAILSAYGTAGAVTPDTQPTVIRAARHDVSAPMRDIVRNMPPGSPMGTEEEPYLIPNILLKPSGIAGRKPYLPTLQRAP